MTTSELRESGTHHCTMRELNRSLVLDTIKRAGPISRSGVSAVTELAKPTVSTIVDVLLAEGLVVERGTAAPAPGGGRPPIMLEYCARRDVVAGVHIGVRRTTVVVADGVGRELHRLQRPSLRGRPVESLTFVAADIASALDGAGVHGSSLRAVAVCVPGLVDGNAGVCHLAPNLRWKDVDVRTLLEPLVGVPVHLRNVAIVAAMAESLEGVGRGVSDQVLLYAGSGIGAGIISDGRPIHGMVGIAGEIGHCRMPGANDRCNCGRKGCLETVASAPAIVRRVRRELARGRESSLRRVRPLTTEAIAQAAADGDLVANEALREAGRRLGVAASWLVNILSPELVVVGGGLAAAGTPLLEAIAETVDELGMPSCRDRLTVTTSALGQDAEVRGAVRVALEESESFHRVVSRA